MKKKNFTKIPIKIVKNIVYTQCGECIIWHFTYKETCVHSLPLPMAVRIVTTCIKIEKSTR